MAKSTEARPTPRQMRSPCMLVERMSRPWLSVPRGYCARPFSSQDGGAKASLRFSPAMLNGACGEIHGAGSAEPTQISVSTAATTVTGERLKLQARSCSQSRRRITALLDGRESRLRAVVEAVDDRHALLHRPRPRLMVQRHVVGLVARDLERFFEHRIALLRVGLDLQLVDHLVELGVADAALVEAAVRPFGLG